MLASISVYCDGDVCDSGGAGDTQGRQHSRLWPRHDTHSQLRLPASGRGITSTSGMGGVCPNVQLGIMYVWPSWSTYV